MEEDSHFSENMGKCILLSSLKILDDLNLSDFLLIS